jgi:hypothetical protein
MRVTLQVGLGILLAASVCVAQQQYMSGAPPLPGPDMMPAFSALSDQPATHTGLTFDRSELQAAQGVLEANGLAATRAAAALTGISFDTFHYAKPAFYTPEAMSALLATYKAGGWKHLVNANQTAANTAQPDKPVTDLWLHFSGADIDAVTVLTRSAKTMNVVRVTGDLRPLDLLHLSGKFGIPKVDPSAVMVPEK